MDITTKRWTAVGIKITLIIGFAGLGFASMSTNSSFIIPYWLPAVLFIASGVSALATILYLVSIRKRKAHRKKKTQVAISQRYPLPKVDYEKIDTVSQQDKEWIGHIGMRMMDTHGHIDLEGMMSDRANGVSLSDLMGKPCSKCGYMRNQRNRNR